MNFDTEAEAWAWLEGAIDDHCVDNHRLAWVGDEASEAAYEAAQAQGCCGSADYLVTIAGRQARIGCNYGH